MNAFASARGLCALLAAADLSSLPAAEEENDWLSAVLAAVGLPVPAFSAGLQVFGDGAVGAVSLPLLSAGVVTAVVQPSSGAAVVVLSNRTEGDVVAKGAQLLGGGADGQGATNGPQGAAEPAHVQLLRAACSDVGMAVPPGLIASTATVSPAAGAS